MPSQQASIYRPVSACILGKKAFVDVAKASGRHDTDGGKAPAKRVAVGLEPIFTDHPGSELGYF